MGGEYSVIAYMQWRRQGLATYGRAGFQAMRRSVDFCESDCAVDLQTENYLVTGANSGIGFEAAKQFALRGANVHLLCRNRERGESAKKSILESTKNQNVFLHICDVSSSKSIRDFAEKWNSEKTPIRALINNAGVMPKERTESADGIELSFATMAGQTFLLTALLLPAFVDRGRVINVSSAGMYNFPLNTDDLNSTRRSYNATYVYAIAKRAQVDLSEKWSRILAKSKVIKNVTVQKKKYIYFTIHPGWAITNGVKTQMPDFFEKQKNTMRSAEQGADTIVWLATATDDVISKASQGAVDGTSQSKSLFWFDRKPAVDGTSMKWSNTKSSDHVQDELWTKLCEMYMFSFDIDSLSEKK